jgi:hypothetical protein
MGALKPACAPLPNVRHVESNSIARRRRDYGAVCNQRSAGEGAPPQRDLRIAIPSSASHVVLGAPAHPIYFRASTSNLLLYSQNQCVSGTPLWTQTVNDTRYGDGPSRSCRNSRLHTIVVLVHARLTVPNLKFLQLYPLSQRAQLKDGAHPQH